MSLCISIKTELRVITRSRILVYRTPLNNKLEEYSSNEVKAIKEIVTDLDYSNCIVFVDGFQKDENYILKENEVATIRQYPSGSSGGQTAYILLGFATFGLTMLADVVIGACGGTRIYDLMTRNKKSAVNKTAQTSTTTENLPSINGAKNQSQENQTYPFVMGKHLYTPAYIGKPYRTISGPDGEEQTYHALYLIDYNSCEVTDFKLGITDIASNKEKQTSGNIVIDSQYYDASEFGIKLEIQESGEVSLYSQKVVEEQLSSELTCEMFDGEKKSLTAYCFSSKYPAKVELEFTYNGLIDFEQDGTEKNATVSVDIEASYDGGKTWGYFANIGTTNQKSGKVIFTSNGTTTTATGKKNAVMRFTAEKTLTLQELKNLHSNGNDIIEFRVKKTSYIESERKSDDVYLTGIRTWVADYKATESRNEIVYQNPMNNVDRDKTTRLGFEIKAHQLLDSQLETLNCIVSSKCKTWNGNEWSLEKTVTQNPSAVALELLQGNLRGDKYKYNDSQLDLESFGAFYEYCEENNFKCNGVLVQQTKTQDVVNTILSCGRGFLTLSGNKYAVCIDKPREFPVMVLNNQNVLEATNEKSFDDIPDGFRVKFINETNGYTEEERDVLVNTNAENPYYEKLEIPYQTDPEQIYKFVWYQWLCRKLRPEVWNRKVSVDGNLIEIGSMVEVQDDTILLGIGDGAEIVQVIVSGDYITGIITDGQFSVEDNSERYGVKITQTSENYSPTVRTVEVELKNGTENEFVFKNPISLNENIIPCIGDNVSFGVYDRITSSALCFAKKDNGDGTFDLTLIPYDDRVYTIPEEIPEFDSKVSVPLQAPEMQPLQSNYVSFEDVKNAVETVEGDAGITVLITPNALTFNSLNDGTITTPIERVCNIVAFRENEEVDFYINSISPVDGFEFTKLNNKQIKVKALAGNKMQESGTIPISVSVASTENALIFGKDPYVFGSEFSVFGGFKSKFNLYVSYSKSMMGNAGDITEIPSYKGAFTSDPLTTDWNDGDYYLYIGDSSVSRTKGKIYSYIKGIWQEDTDATHNMSALQNAIEYVTSEDITQDATFASIFAKNLVTNSAFIQNLFAQYITLGGYIQSENYSDTSGFRISSDGTCKFVNIETDNAMLKNTLLRLTKSLSFTIDRITMDDSYIMNRFEQNRIDIFSTYGKVNDNWINGQLNWQFSITDKNTQQTTFLYSLPMASIRLYCDETKLTIKTKTVLMFNKTSNQLVNENIEIRYEKDNYWRVTFQGATNLAIPDDVSGTNFDDYVFEVGFNF